MNNVQIDSKKRKIAKVRSIINGVSTRPRISVFRSNKALYVQAIDDLAGKTIASHYTGNLKVNTNKNNLESAKELGIEFGNKLKEIKISKVVFDRRWYKYHGRIKTLAEGIRSSGVNF